MLDVLASQRSVHNVLNVASQLLHSSYSAKSSDMHQEFFNLVTVTNSDISTNLYKSKNILRYLKITDKSEVYNFFHKNYLETYIQIFGDKV